MLSPSETQKMGPKKLLRDESIFQVRSAEGTGRPGTIQPLEKKAQGDLNHVYKHLVWNTDRDVKMYPDS